MPQGAVSEEYSYTMNLLFAELLIAPLVLGTVGLLIVAIVDLARRPSSAWEASGHNQLVWALVVIFVGFIGPLLYLLIARPALEAATPFERSW